MASVTFNSNATRQVPIHRNSMFFSKESYDFDLAIAKEYLEEDMNQTAVLYQVDASSTNVNTTYGETKEGGVRYKTPVEFHCIYEIEEPELKAYDTSKNLGTYMKTGKLKLYVLEATLTELGIDIKKGDYIGIQINNQHAEYFSVANSGANNYDNAHLMYGTKPFFRTVEGVPVDASEFKA